MNNYYHRIVFFEGCHQLVCCYRQPWQLKNLIILCVQLYKSDGWKKHERYLAIHTVQKSIHIVMNWLLSSHIREPFCMNEYKSNSNRGRRTSSYFVLVTEIIDRVNGATVYCPIQNNRNLFVISEWLGGVCDPASHRQHKQTKANLNKHSIPWYFFVDPLDVVSFPQ